ncbi:MAG TPA: hypothetical protein VGL16_04065 [Actinomycetota bacterium]
MAQAIFVPFTWPKRLAQNNTSGSKLVEPAVLKALRISNSLLKTERPDGTPERKADGSVGQAEIEIYAPRPDAKNPNLLNRADEKNGRIRVKSGIDPNYRCIIIALLLSQSQIDRLKVETSPDEVVFGLWNGSSRYSLSLHDGTPLTRPVWDQFLKNQPPARKSRF